MPTTDRLFTVRRAVDFRKRVKQQSDNRSLYHFVFAASQSLPPRPYDLPTFGAVPTYNFPYTNMTCYRAVPGPEVSPPRTHGRRVSRVCVFMRVVRRLFGGDVPTPTLPQSRGTICCCRCHRIPSHPLVGLRDANRQATSCLVCCRMPQELIDSDSGGTGASATTRPSTDLLRSSLAMAAPLH